MSVLDGPRREVRRILYEGIPQWVKTDGDDLLLGDGRRVRESDAVYLPPCNPTKVICVHLNYDSRRLEMGDPLMLPSYFLKPPSSLNSHRGKIYRPANCQYLNYEGELVVQIGVPVKGMNPDDVWDVVNGFCPGNDVGLHDFREADRGSMLRLKGMDSLGPVGPGMVSGIDVRKEVLKTYLNGKIVQQAVIEEMIYSIGYMLADLSRYMTLMPGDLVFTGTPANSRPMSMGDVVEVEITNVGKLTNTVVEIPNAKYEGGHQPTDSELVRKICRGGDYVHKKPK
jgi:5-oxopent-3-ene-1,2,5-tricarboxylate decarboxylase/2-hydroxyhepta-2,4-diene-1,7-dioate isomerase